MIKKVTVATSSGQTTYETRDWSVVDGILVVEENEEYLCFPLTSVLWYKHPKETENAN